MAETIWVNRSDLTDMMVNEDSMPVLAEGAVRFRVESFAVTANNVTYAIAGDSFGYWNFFPAGEGFGVVPMWGHARAEQSNHPDIAKGERAFGYLPMGTHFDVVAASVTLQGFVDAAPHRQPMSPIYNQYSRLAADPEHDPDHENERMIFGPLFKTGYLIEHMFRGVQWHGAKSMVMTSASSKTSMGLASCTRQSSPAIKRVGLTSQANVDFVTATGLYDAVLDYDAIGELAAEPSVVVDFAGNGALLKAIHAQLGRDLKYSCLVGATHAGAPTAGLQGITGPEPILFFAPDHAVAAIKESGAKLFGQAVGESWQKFLASIGGVMTIDERSGVIAAADAFQATLKNEAEPGVGIVVNP